MSDSFTNALLLRKPEPNANQNLWGPLLNEDFGSDRLEQAIVGVASYALSGSKTLSRTNGETDEARMRVQQITSGTGGTVTIPAVAIWYWFINNASGPVTVTNGSNGVVVPAGSSTLVCSPDGAALIVGLTKKYVDDLAFNAALPGQTGQAKKFVTTDGSSGFFDFVSLTESIKGILPVANGGTGVATLAALKSSLAGWTPIGSPAALAGQSAATFSSIPTTFANLLVVVSELSTTATATLALELSDDGASFTDPLSIYMGGSLTSASFFYGSISLPGFRLGAGSGFAAINEENASKWIEAEGKTFAWRCPAITALRVKVSTGTFDAGTLTLYGQ